jgi:hypothetical protein
LERIQFLIERSLIIAIPEFHPKKIDPLNAILHAHLLDEVLDLAPQRGRHDDKLTFDFNAIIEDERTGDQVVLILKYEALDRLVLGLAIKELAATDDVDGLIEGLSIVDELWGTIFHEFLSHFQKRMGIGSK